MKLYHLLYASRRRWMVVTAITFTALWLFAGNSTPALAATTWTVTRLDDRNNASCVAGDCSLREAIKSANAGAGGDTINFASGLNGTITLLVVALPNIAKSVTIEGGGVITISGANNFRIFYVPTGVTLTLNNIILENGNSGSDYGGAIYVDHGTLVLNNSTVQNSQTNNLSGGAIVNFSGAVTLNNSIVQGNTGYSFGAISSSGTVTLTNNSIVRNNTATMGAGGFSVGGKVTINNSQIYSNTASSEHGGGLRILSGAQVSINNSQIYSNHANSGSGGGIYSQGTLTVTQTTLSGNTANYGGGIWNDVSKTTLTNVTLSGNLATGDGGGIGNGESTTTLTNVTLSGNSATGVGGGGGGIYNINLSTATLTNVTLSGNSATGGSGGGILNAATATLTNVTLSGNSATGTSGTGGGIYNFTGTVTLTNVTFSGNSATDIGGGISNNLGTATLTNVTLSGNSAIGGGGGILHYSNIAGRTITLKNTIVANSPSGENCENGAGSTINIASSGFNLSSDNSCAFNQASDQNNKSAQLGPLANNGGFTLTHMPLPPIVAHVGPIDNGSCLAGSFDQRGVMRPQGAACDIGAVERKPGDFGVYLNLPLIVR